MEKSELLKKLEQQEKEIAKSLNYVCNLMIEENLRLIKKEYGGSVGSIVLSRGWRVI